jgi:hypothetical protein
MGPERDTEKLRAEQLQRERSEHDRASHAYDEQDAAQHERRADKARYLREKLEERAESEDQAAAHDAAEDQRGDAPEQ